MRPKISVIGIGKTSRMFGKMASNDDEFDKLAEHSMKRIQSSAFQKGPVDTGFLTSNLAADENRVRTSGVPTGSWDLVDGTEYTIRQEFEHASKSGFIRDSVIEEEPKFKEAVEKLAKEKKWTL